MMPRVAVLPLVSVYVACAPIRPVWFAVAAEIRAFGVIRWPERPSRRPEGQDDVDRQARRWPWGRPLLHRSGRAGSRGLLRGRGRGRRRVDGNGRGEARARG